MIDVYSTYSDKCVYIAKVVYLTKLLICFLVHFNNVSSPTIAHSARPILVRINMHETNT